MCCPRKLPLPLHKLCKLPRKPQATQPQCGVWLALEHGPGAALRLATATLLHGRPSCVLHRLGIKLAYWMDTASAVTATWRVAWCHAPSSGCSGLGGT